MSSTPLHEPPQPDELLPWFVNHMRSFGEWEAIDDHASSSAVDTTDDCALDKDQAADQDSSASGAK